jgi:hypothetical protein
MRPDKATANAAEERFARYLRERGYTFDRESDLGIPSRPDFAISANGHTVVAEVKSFDTDGIFEGLAPGQLGARGASEAFGPIRRQIKKAASQLRSLSDRGLPLVVVLDNPAGKPVPISSPYMIMSAMYGDLMMQADISTDGSLGRWQALAGRNGKLRNDHQYLSAVVVIRHEFEATKWAAAWFEERRAAFGVEDTRTLSAAFLEASKSAPGGDEIYVEVYESLSTAATPLPRDVYDGPRDTRWAPNDARDSLIRIK